MKAARDHLADLVGRLRIGCVYVDLDGTLAGPGGSLFATRDGLSSDAALALHALLHANVAVVVMSGRNEDQVREAARIVGAGGFIAEMGGIVVHRDGAEELRTTNFGSFAGEGRPFDAIVRSGAAGTLLEAFRGRLEPHAPWSFLSRRCTVLLRGHVPEDEARSMLERNGYGWLDVLDNGILSGPSRRFPGLDVDEVHVYHLLPRGVSKASAIAADRHRRGLASEACIAVGDAASDAGVAGEVAAVFIVANGEGALAGREVAENVFLLERPHGAGFAEAVTAFVGAGS